MEAFINLSIYSTNINLVSTIFQGAYKPSSRNNLTHTIKPLNKCRVCWMKKMVWSKFKRLVIWGGTKKLVLLLP